MENKKKLCEQFETLVKSTESGKNIESIEYIERYKKTLPIEVVKITFTSGKNRTVSVDCDSGIQMLADVIGYLL